MNREWSEIAAEGDFINIGENGIRDVLDGTSNTAMFLEKSADPVNYFFVSDQSVARARGETGGWFAPGAWTNARELRTYTTASGETGLGIKPDNVPRGEFISGDSFPIDERNFGGPHPGVLMTVFGDGSTRSLNNNIRPSVFFQVLTRDDGEIVATDSL